MGYPPKTNHFLEVEAYNLLEKERLIEMLIASNDYINKRLSNISELIAEWEQFRTDNWYTSKNSDVEEILRKKFQLYYNTYLDT
jgi:hypothetical protein